MELREAMIYRHTVRKYKRKKLEADIVEKINDRIDLNNLIYNLNMKLMTQKKDAVKGLFKTFCTKNVKNYIILSCDDSKDLLEKIGYCSADIMLYAQTLGLNTWFIGETYNKKIETYADGKKVFGVIVLGYGKTKGKKHKSKKVEEVSFYDGITPGWFAEGVKASLLAPTALNKQAFFITGKGTDVTAICNNGKYTNIDLGIIKYYFELGAGKDNFSWRAV